MDTNENLKEYFSQENFPFEVLEVRDNHSNLHFVTTDEVLESILASPAAEIEKYFKALQYLEITSGKRKRDVYLKNIAKEVLSKRLGEHSSD